jgi:hypothetical protein
MMGVSVIDVRLMPTGTPVDGTTAWSDELELDGDPRLLMWVGVLDDARPQVHFLFDTKDFEKGFAEVLYRAADMVGQLTSGTVFATLNSVENAQVRVYPS